jgi:hypothetical protein
MKRGRPTTRHFVDRSPSKGNVAKDTRLPPKLLPTQKALRILRRVAAQRSCPPDDVLAARVEMMKIMRVDGASTKIEAGDCSRTAEEWWRTLGGLA